MRDDELFVFIAALFLLAEDDDLKLHMELWERLRSRLLLSEKMDPELSMLLDRILRGYPRRGRSRSRYLAEAREIAEATVGGFRRSFEDTFEAQIEGLSDSISSVRQDCDRIMADTSALGTAHKRTAHDIHSLFWLLNVGADLKAAELERFVPVRVFLSDVPEHNEFLERIQKRIVQFGASLGFDAAEDLPGESGSWWKRLFLRTRSPITQDGVAEAIEKGKVAVELHILDKPQAEANREQAEAAARVIESLKDVPKACIQVGSLLVVKHIDGDGCASIETRTLSTMALKRIEENQHMLRHPEKVLGFLDHCGRPLRAKKPPAIEG